MNHLIHDLPGGVCASLPGTPGRSPEVSRPGAGPALLAPVGGAEGGTGLAPTMGRSRGAAGGACAPRPPVRRTQASPVPAVPASGTGRRGNGPGPAAGKQRARTVPAAIRTIGTLSGGAGSWGACRRWIDEYGADGMVLLFTDVGGDGTNPFTGEDEDTLRFLRDAAADLGAPLIYLRDGRDIWDVFREKRWLGNASLAHCSWELKTGPARQWIEENAPAAERVIFGIDSTEIHRMPAITKAWEPYEAVAPLTQKPLLWKPQLIRMMRERGIAPPRMYELGYGHANCPACVKAGQGHWARLLKIWPERYAYAEEQEEKLRAELGDVAILRDRSGGESRPMTLREFRERAEDDHGQLDLFEEGGCACFA